MWAEIGPIHSWAEVGPTLFGLSPTQSVGPDQPSPFNIIYIIFCIIYIYIYMKKIIKILQKIIKNICDFVVILLLYFD